MWYRILEQRSHPNSMTRTNIIILLRERRLGIILPLTIVIQETSQPGDLRGQIHNDDLHLDLEVQPENFFACLQRLRPRRHEHIPVKTEDLQSVDELAEFGAPGKDTKLSDVLCKPWILASTMTKTYLAVLFPSSVKNIGCTFKGIVECVVLLNHAGLRNVRLGCGLRLGLKKQKYELRICATRGSLNPYFWSGWWVLEPLVSRVISFIAKVHCISWFVPAVAHVGRRFAND